MPKISSAMCHPRASLRAAQRLCSSVVFWRKVEAASLPCPLPLPLPVTWSRDVILSYFSKLVIVDPTEPMRQMTWMMMNSAAK